jgi:nucleoside-diphosphate-sugar epimerase
VFDVVDATLLALAHDDSAVQVYNVGTGRGYTTREIAERIIRLAGKRVKPIHKPTQHKSCKVICDISHARSILGYEPQMKLDEGLTDEIRYFADNPKHWREL